ncbi:MAG: TolC family outer membrane protein [Pseudomonadota bacterium]
MKQSALIPLLMILAMAVATPALADIDGTTTLKETVVDAVKQHPQIKSMLFNREAVSRDLSAALGRFFPSLDLSSQYGFQQYNSSTARALGNEDRTRTASDSSLTLTQNVFDGMGRLSTYQGSKARLESAENRLFDMVDTIALSAIRAHFDVVRTRKLTALAEGNITDHQSVLESIAERVAGGAGSKADEMQARGRVARAETTLITYVGELHTAEAEYVRQTGKTPGPLADQDFTPEYVPASLDQVLETSIADNPKIKARTADVEAVTQDRDLTRSSYYPDIDIKVSSRYTDHLDGSSTHLRDDRAMLAMSWNLFSGGTDYQSSQAANARIRQAQEDLHDTTDELTRQVATTWAEYNTAVGQVDKHQEALYYSIESRDMYLMQFNVGQRSLLDVLDAINEVFSNSVLLETAQSNRDFTLYKFLNLQGRLVKTLEVSESAYTTLPQ